MEIIKIAFPYCPLINQFNLNLFKNTQSLYLFSHATWHVESWFPDQESNPDPLQCKLRVLTIGPPVKSQEYIKS